MVPVYIDVGFSDAHRLAIHQALDTWNLALNGYERFEVASDKFDMEPETLETIDFTGQGLVVLKRMHEDDVVKSLPDGVLAWVPMPSYGEAHSLDIIADVIGNRDLRTICMHELGHVLGIPHLPIRGSLMFSTYPNSPCIDRATVQALATIRRWEWKHLNFCERPL